MTDSLRPFLIKAASFCAYQERTIGEVSDKLIEWGLDANQTDDVVAELIAQKYLNEARFTASFVRGKFRHNHWGRIKIRQELKLRGISNDLIVKGFKEIDDQEYETTLREILDKKARTLKGEQPLLRKQKLVRYAQSKGFEADLIWEILSVINNQ
jgi:regulatory protein